MKSKLPLILALFLLTSCDLIKKPPSINEDKELMKKFDSVDVPTVERSLYKSAREASERGDYLRAEQFYGQLIAKNPNNAVYKQEYALNLRRVGEFEAALGIYNELLAKDPRNIELNEAKGLCLLSMGKFPEAGNIFEQIIKTDSRRWKSINGAGLIFATKSKFQEANQYFDLAASVSGNNPTVLNNQALTKALMGNNDDSINILRDALRRSKDNTEQKRRIALNLAMVLGISGDLDAAKDTAKPYLTEPQLYNNLGIYAELGKNPELARTYLNKAMSGTNIYYDKAWDNLERLEKKL